MGEDRDRNRDRVRVRVRGEVKVKQEREQSKYEKLKKVANVLATAVTAAVGVGLAGTAQEALNSAPPPISEQAPELDPLSRRPPEGVVFGKVEEVGKVEKSRAGGPVPDAPVEPVLTKRVFILF